MTKPNPIRRRSYSSEDGYILIWVLFMVVILTLAMSVAAPKIAREIQLDRERETMERGKQYRRAIQLYYRKFHAYPPNVDALVKTNEIRFLRKKYTDPMTGKDDWKPVLFGQNKTPTAMGFFGQPMAGSTMAGIGPSGGNGLNGSAPLGSQGSPLAGGGPFSGGSSPFSGGTSFGSSNPGTPSGGTGTNNGGGTVSTGSQSGTGSSGSSSGAGSATGSPTGSSGGLSGQTFGGAGIIGFTPGGTKQSILIYKKKSHYNEWEFVYDPISDMPTIPGGASGPVGAPVGASPGAGPGVGSFFPSPPGANSPPPAPTSPAPQ